MTLNPLTFVFSDGEVERAFALYQGEEHLRIEHSHVLLDAVLLIAFSISDRSPDGWLVKSFISTPLVMYLVLQATTLRDISVRYRFWMQFAYRCIRLVAFKVISPLWIVPSTSESFLGAIALRSGVTVLFWDGIGLQTRFCEFFLLQGIFTIVMVSALSDSVCCGVLQNTDAVDFATRVRRTIQSVSKKFFWYDGNRMHLMENTTSTASCAVLVSIAHFAISFTLPVLIVWILEIRSRCLFLESLSRNGTWMGFHLRNLWKLIVYVYSGTTNEMVL